MPGLINRRNGLRSIAGAAACGLVPEPLIGAEASGEAAVVDTHLHCFAGPDQERFPYHPRAPYRPEQPATPEHLLQCMDGAGVDHAIVVHPEPYQDDHRYLIHCLEVGDGRLKGTCLFFADRPQSLGRMPEFLRRHEGRIIAARIHAYVQSRLPPFGEPELRQYWRHAADAGIAVQLHFEPRYAPGFRSYIEEFSDTKVIIDHLGRPMQGTPEEHDEVLGWSSYPNTIMKLSSIPRQDRYPHRDVGPIIDRIVQLWGPQRLIYGGGFGADATPESYRDYREDLRAHLGRLTDTEQAEVFGGNAMRLFGFRG